MVNPSKFAETLDLTAKEDLADFHYSSSLQGILSETTPTKNICQRPENFLASAITANITLECWLLLGLVVGVAGAVLWVSASPAGATQGVAPDIINIIMLRIWTITQPISGDTHMRSR